MDINDLHTSRSATPDTGRAPASDPHPLHTLLVDSCRMGPAPTRAREGAVVVATVIIVALAVALIRPPVALSAIVLAFTAVTLAVRWVIGTRKWNAR